MRLDKLLRQCFLEDKSRMARLMAKVQEKAEECTTVESCGPDEAVASWKGEQGEAKIAPSQSGKA